MVRKKQGKSQIKHLKTRGKSKAGSRVRLANTVRFFNEIHERLKSYLHNYTIDRIALSCSKTLIPFFFADNINPSVHKNDERIIKIPMDVPVPGYNTLLRVNHFMEKAEIQVLKPDNPFIDNFPFLF
jgi:hypothetical protein